MSIENYIQKAVTIFSKTIDSNLIGVYLHGSLAMGCFNTDSSDIDLLVVVKEKLPLSIKKVIIKEIIQLEESTPSYPIEMSIITERTVIDFEYPTPFELHYSMAHKDKYINDENYICGNDLDPDLAAHLVVIYNRGICLIGKPISDVFKPIDPHYYIRSILFDINDAIEAIVENPVYYSLNLCRVLYYLREKVVSSKKEGGEWGVRSLPSRYKTLISDALEKYKCSSINRAFDQAHLINFAEFMTAEINKELKGY
ncbi:aminoglycoside adenylyltransferase domain-containing protein [Ferdinandcohnia quinoae]|uniref:Spectinomycin 9-adenylyltransferase n=1 Tax=Fredinandcohnia quinoae TaxID=2918902 RepID=A0AAW5E7L9_9BACI|nr:aminoglycoside adenylyltransferase domain-containing protein [Fredinandcohnia sp. SECRCQ15]MCH1625391.1 DUF4111 domain-containing protein [Fredinandcohnia sp. SECRCQ15]